MNKAISAILYAGIGKEEFEALRKDCTEQNRNNLFWYSLVVMCFFGILGIFVLLTKGAFFENAIPYFGTALVMALIMVCTRFPDKTDKTEACVRFLMYFFTVVLYAEAAVVTLRHPEFPAVTFMGVLLVLPLLFIDRPIIIMLLQAVFVAVFCLLAIRYKAPNVSSTDVWNAITFMIISWAEILILIPMRLGSMQKTKRIEFLSKNDILTGVLNRNAYEEHLIAISEKADESLVCIYADVNGLHEMNNTYGHEAGDRMLQTISGELMNAFGHDRTYRIGGDEFVVFSADTDSEAVLQLLSVIRDTLAARNYFVSFGISAVRDHGMDIQSTVKDAEQSMYDAKRQFYIESGRDRRTRN